MNEKTIGTENLPNVFIDNISLYKRSSGYTIKTTITMYDHKERPRWKGRINDLYIKILLSSDIETSNLLNNGQISLFDLNAPTDRFKIVSTNSLVKNVSEGDYESYSFTVEDVIPFNPEHLNVYVACFLGGLRFRNSSLNKFYGPMAGEKVLVGNQINNVSNYFYYPDTNEEYAGPVHQKPDGSYMEGSQHSDEPHKDVVLVTEENYKIQAYKINFDLTLVE